MKLITVDLETFWDANHTLSKMSPIAYVMDSKTQLICMGIKIGDGETQVVFGEHKIREVIDGIDWSNAYVIGHNMSGFDSMVLAWRLGVKPKLWGCTLAMARPIHAKTIGNSLEKLVQHYGIGVKDKTVLVNTKGKRLEDFTADEIEAMAKYNAADVDQCYQLFTKLRPFYTAKELWLIDATIRMLVEPKFVIDRNLLESALAEERENKRKAIMAVADHLQRMGLATDEMALCTTEEALEEAVRKALASANKFAVLLKSLGVEVPMKPSPTNPDKLVPALAKTDEQFQKLKEHDNPVVAAAVRARLAVRSTILETRIETFLEITDAVGGKLPVALHYCGADTTGRWSGWSGNIQNLPRITPDKPKPSDALRKSMRAPEGYKVIVADQSGIELRVNHFLWKVPSSMALYKKDRKADLYKAFAAARYSISPEEVTKEQRQLAKLCLAEGTLVLTKRGEIPIEQVTASDKVWDGVEWVSTLGAIYRGEKEVIEYDGLIATPDHEVWTDCGRKVPLWYAAAQSLRLARTGAGGVPLGFSGASNDGDLQNQEAQIRESTLRVVRNDKTDFIRQPESWEDTRVSVVQSEMRSTKMAFATARSSQTEMYKHEGQGVRQIRRSGDSVQVQECSGSSRVGNGKFGSAQRQGVGQDRQQRPLRAGESTVGYTKAECGESESVAIEAVPLVSGTTSRDTLRGHHASQLAIEGVNVRADNREVEPPVRQTKRRVWDLLNCGPRNRFTANGRLVSNCQLGLGFGCGWKKFKLIAKTMGGLDLSDAEAEAVTTDWRNNYPEIVRGWRVCHEALQWIHDGIERPIDPWGLCWTSKHGIRLPSGRFIRYPNLHLEKTSDGNYEWWYGQGRHRTRIYAGKVTENLIQSLARDIIADNMFSFYKETGLYPALMVHDELVYVVPENQAEKLLDKLQQIMRTPPQWWPDIVLESEGDMADTYGDAK